MKDKNVRHPRIFFSKTLERLKDFSKFDVLIKKICTVNIGSYNCHCTLVVFSICDIFD